MERSKALLKQIIREEVKLSTHGASFTHKNHIYPINIVLFEHRSKLGYFQADLWEIGLNKELLFYQEFFLKEVLRHEFAHYLTYIEFGHQAPHGAQYRSVCKRYGWHEEMKATIDASSLEEKKPKEILGKVAKLLELGKSANVHEAELAMTKARELLCKHQLQFAEESETHIFKRIFLERRVSQKMRCIGEILRQFFVYPIMNHGKGQVYLEIFGKELHVEVAEYVGQFLYRKFDELWEEERKRTKLKGLRAKHSFFHGVTKGFIEKQRQDKVAERALALANKDLEESVRYAHPRMTRSINHAQSDPRAFSRGKQVGDKLQINSPLNENRNPMKFIT